MGGISECMVGWYLVRTAKTRFSHMDPHAQSSSVIPYPTTKSGTSAATSESITIPTRWALHPPSSSGSSNLPKPPSEGRNTFLNPDGMTSFILLSNRARISLTSSSVGSGGVGAGYPSSGKRTCSRMSMSLSDDLGVRRCVRIKWGRILSSTGEHNPSPISSAPNPSRGPHLLCSVPALPSTPSSTRRRCSVGSKHR